MRIIRLQNKTTEPPFKYFVKKNKSNSDYYVFDDLEEAMEQAKVLSLTEFPVTIVFEPFEDKYGEWFLKRLFIFMEGSCEEEVAELLHVKFYTDAGRCLN